MRVAHHAAPQQVSRLNDAPLHGEYDDAMTETAFRVFDANSSGRDFVVGDIHGQGAMLDCLLAEVRFDTACDRLFSLGDLIDRGPDSEATLVRFSREPSFFCIRGNHESLLLAALDDWRYRRAWERNGGDWGCRVSEERLLELAEMVHRMPLAIELSLADGRRIGLVHAEVAPGATWDQVRQSTIKPRDRIDDYATTLEASLMWGRKRFNALAMMRNDPGASALTTVSREKTVATVGAVDGIDMVMVGHSILQLREPLRAANVVFIDTGAYEHKGRLTLVEPLHDRYWQCSHGERPFARSGNPRVLPDAVTLPEAYLTTAPAIAAGV